MVLVFVKPPKPFAACCPQVKPLKAAIGNVIGHHWVNCYIPAVGNGPGNIIHPGPDNTVLCHKAADCMNTVDTVKLLFEIGGQLAGACILFKGRYLCQLAFQFLIQLNSVIIEYSFSRGRVTVKAGNQGSAELWVV